MTTSRQRRAGEEHSGSRISSPTTTRVDLRCVSHLELSCVRPDFERAAADFRSGFDELRDLCLTADDQRSLAIAMSGPIMETYFNAERREASALATEQVRLLESIGDPTLTLALLTAANIGQA